MSSLGWTQGNIAMRLWLDSIRNGIGIGSGRCCCAKGLHLASHLTQGNFLYQILIFTVVFVTVIVMTFAKLQLKLLAAAAVVDGRFGRQWRRW